MPAIFIKILILLAYLGSVLVLIYGAWLIVPFFYQLPWVPTDKARARKALKMAKLQPGEIFYDLGAGDGRILLLAAEEFGAKAIGVEASPLQYLFTAARCYFSGAKPKIQVRRENFYKADFSDADVVFAYMTPDHAIRFQDRFVTQLKPGARVVMIAFDFPYWMPSDVNQDELIFLYEMPPQEGGLTAYLLAQNE
jgi:cyclopropane fatty-acyl-phospholipid synthase-like methyltransferase